MFCRVFVLLLLIKPLSGIKTSGKLAGSVGPGSQLTVCTERYGVHTFVVKNVSILGLYGVEAIVPYAALITDVIEEEVVVSCPGVTHGCDKKSKAFSSRGLKIAASGAVLGRSQYGQPLGCPKPGSYEVCAAVKCKATKMIKVLKRATQTCNVEVNKHDHINLNIQVNNCNLPVYALEHGGRVSFDQEQAEFYKQSSPCYYTNGTWNTIADRFQILGGNHLWAHWQHEAEFDAKILCSNKYCNYQESGVKALITYEVEIGDNDTFNCKSDTKKDNCTDSDQLSYKHLHTGRDQNGTWHVTGLCNSTTPCIGCVKVGNNERCMNFENKACTFEGLLHGEVTYNKLKIGEVPETRKPKLTEVKLWNQRNIMALCIGLIIVVSAPSLLMSWKFVFFLVMVLYLNSSGAMAMDEHTIISIDNCLMGCSLQYHQLWPFSLLIQFSFNKIHKMHWSNMIIQLLITYASGYSEHNMRLLAFVLILLKMYLCESEKLKGILDKCAGKTESIEVINKSAVYAKYSMEVVFGEFKRIRDRKKIPIRGRVRNVRNMNGSLFYASEYYHLEKTLRKMSAKEIADMYKYFPPLTIREHMTDEQMANLLKVVSEHVATKKEIKKLKLID